MTTFSFHRSFNSGRSIEILIIVC